ncbi:MAG: PDZ domain-containing protein [Gemmatimonadetes bacterium]|nr:PDZ domain-containing protein [Gemmatimonadota bacterium]
MRRTLLVLGTLLLAASGSAPLAAQQVRVFTNTDRQAVAAGDRAMIGVSTSSGSKRDTLGVLIASVTEGGPAEKAGLSEGDRIQAINGVSLRVSREDAGDDEMGGIMQRRLTRELGKAKAGDEVALQVWHDGASKSYKLKTVAADDLYKPARAVEREERAAIGLGFGLTGSKRDTAGVFVNSVTEDGPAEKAGIIEGDRIAAINGVSLKLSKDDLEDAWVASSRLNRLSREVAKAKAGDVVELTVVSGGRTRAVKVTTVKASALKKGSGGAFTFFRSPDAAMAPMPPMPPMPSMSFTVPSVPRAPAAPRVPLLRYRTIDGDEAEVQVQLQVDAARRELQRVMQTEMPKMRAEIERTMKAELPRVREQTQRALQETRRSLEATRVRLRTARVVRI